MRRSYLGWEPRQFPLSGRPWLFTNGLAPVPPYMHIHRSDDEAWHVLEGTLRFRFADGEIDAPAGTTVFVLAGSPHVYWETEPSRYLIFLTPRLDRLISRLHRLTDQSQLLAILTEFDTVLVEERAN